MTRDKAIEDAAFYADNRGPIVWSRNFIASLAASGYAVVPLEATNRILTHMAECKCLTELWRAGVAAAQKETGE